MEAKEALTEDKLEGYGLDSCAAFAVFHIDCAPPGKHFVVGYSHLLSSNRPGQFRRPAEKRLLYSAEVLVA